MVLLRESVDAFMLGVIYLSRQHMIISVLLPGFMGLRPGSLIPATTNRNQALTRGVLIFSREGLLLYTGQPIVWLADFESVGVE